MPFFGKKCAKEGYNPPNNLNSGKIEENMMCVFKYRPFLRSKESITFNSNAEGNERFVASSKK